MRGEGEVLALSVAPLNRSCQMDGIKSADVEWKWLRCSDHDRFINVYEYDVLENGSSVSR